MSTVIAGMQHVSLPRFASASAKRGSMNVSGGEANDGQNLASMFRGTTGQDDQFDFDLLAEYLLDDGGGFPGCDLAPPRAPREGASFPDYLAAAASTADPLADAHAQLTANSGNKQSGIKSDIAGDLAQVQQIIAAHAARAQQASGHPDQQQTQGLGPHQRIINQVQSMTLAGGQSGGTPLMHPGMGIPQLPSQTIPAAVSLPTMMTHQHSAPARNSTGNVQTQQHTEILSGSKRLLPVDLPGQRRQKSQAQISRRRERNRILARRTRLRKKFFFESLQKEVTDLQRENIALKEIVKTKVEHGEASKILDECRAELPSIVLESCGDATELDKQDFSLIQSLQTSQQCFVITDPSLQDNPIVYASEGFVSLTGYTREEVLGRNCRFLQGTETNLTKIETISKALSAGEDVSVCVVNYTADGTPFWNQLFIAALRDANNNIVNFVGVLVRVSGPPPEDVEHGKLLPGEEEIGEEEAGNDMTAEVSSSGEIVGIDDSAPDIDVIGDT